MAASNTRFTQNSLGQSKTPIDSDHGIYRGAGPAIADILAGQIPMIVPAMTNHVLELHRAGKLKVLAVTHGTRLTAAPELPTAVEQGLTDLVAPNFVGVFAPAEPRSRSSSRLRRRILLCWPTATTGSC